MKKAKKRTEEDLNFWQPTSDLLTGLLYILMLVIVLLGLHLVQVPDYDEIDSELGSSYYEYASPTPSPTEEPGGDHGGRESWGGRSEASPTPTISVSGGGGGGTPTPQPTPSPTPTPTPTPIPPSAGGGGGDNKGPGEGDEPGLKAAVYVMMVDADTEKTIKQGDVEFELYSAGGPLQVLNAYYPEKITYRSYFTSEDGAFFFPEKIEEGAYELHELTEPEGYDASDNVYFELEETYDWPDPYVVLVPLTPSRNIIRIQMNDIETGANISGGSFEIIAADNIVTQDGTLRYRAGQTVGEITCNETGYGESEEVFLGNYILHQLEIPEYYASHREDVDVEVSKKTSNPPAVNSLHSERTRININVSDELYNTRVVSGAEFTITPSRGLPFTATTDHLGRIRIENVSKATTYRITQSAASGNYLVNPAEYTVSVSAEGRMNGESSVDVNLTNRMIRVSFSMTDGFSDVQIPGVGLYLYNAEDELIHQWTTTAVAQNYEDLAPGSYYILEGDNPDQRHDILVRDQAEIQRIDVNSSFIRHYLLYGVIALIVILAAVIFFLVRRKKKKAAESGKE